MKITILPSEKGDCLLVEGLGGEAVLADGGMRGSYTEAVRPFLGAWAAAGGKLDLVYVSHVDQDHIAGVLQLLEDMVLWRVHEHKLSKGQASHAPGFAKPPAVARIWHNAFKALVPDNAGQIATMLAASANSLSNSTNPAALHLAAAYRNIANSIPEAIKVSRRIASDQLKIPLNGEFGGRLAMVRPGDPPIVLKPGGGLSIKLLGPFEKDLAILRDYWNAWLRDVKNADTLESLERWLDRAKGPLVGTAGMGLSIDDELGHRDNVTEPNLASLMLLLEEAQPNGRTVRVMLTGDGHHEDILAGLREHGLMAPGQGQGAHVDVLKVQHHGSEHNLDRAFVKAVTADHYIFCGDGEHENPDLRVLQVLLESRLGEPGQRSANAETGRPFTVWVSASAAVMKAKVAKALADGKDPKELKAAHAHMTALERDLKRWKAKSGGRMSVKLLKDAPLVLQP